MKTTTAFAFAPSALAAALALALPLAARADSSEPAQALIPCTYVGRLMDAEHVGFDTNRVAEITAYDDATGKPVATSTTFYQADSRRNYALRIPMASKAVDGALVPGSTVRIEVTEPNRRKWSGLVVENDAKLGGPGSVKEVDIVLASCSNAYGIDDQLFRDLSLAWQYSAYHRDGEEFDPRKDYDGDGVSTIDEALSGTNPFDPEDKLSIVSFSRGDQGGAKDVLSFRCSQGRAYSLEVTESLDNPDWKRKSFSLNESGTPINYISIPATGSGEETPTVYLLPATGKSAFFRVRSE